jgi:hypothetical protein
MAGDDAISEVTLRGVDAMSDASISERLDFLGKAATSGGPAIFGEDTMPRPGSGTLWGEVITSYKHSIPHKDTMLPKPPLPAEAIMPYSPSMHKDSTMFEIMAGEAAGELVRAPEFASPGNQGMDRGPADLAAHGLPSACVFVAK